MAQQKTAQTSRLAQKANANDASSKSGVETMRIDKWLWCARFYKTRGLAVEALEKNRVLLNEAPCKASKEVRIGDRITLRQGTIQKHIEVKGINPTRGPAPIAQQMYEESAESIAERERVAQLHRLAPEPGIEYRHGRPTKKDRREMDQLKGQWDRNQNTERASLNTRWRSQLESDN